MSGKRKRLTSSGIDKTAYTYENTDPNSVNRERYNPDAEKYMTWDPEITLGHEKPDMRHDWEMDKELRHPTLNVVVPPQDARMAALRTAQVLAKKSTLSIRIARSLFPDGTDPFIEAQATDLMDLPLQALKTTVARIQKYAEESEALESMSSSAESEDLDKDSSETESGMDQMSAKREDPEMDQMDAPTKGTDTSPSATKQPDPAVVSKNEAEQRKQMADTQKGGEAAGQEVHMPGVNLGDDMVGDVDQVDLMDLDSELQDADSDEDSDESKVSNEDLDSLFDKDEDSEMESANKEASLRTASKNARVGEQKKGVKKIASGPRNGNLGVTDLSNLWKSDPDVSNIFG